MSILTPEIASLFSGLDSACIADGEVVSSHVMRTLVMNANRLLADGGEPIYHGLWDIGGDINEIPQGGHGGYGWPFFVQILPGPLTRQKKPGITRYTLFVYATARADERIYIQIENKVSPLNENADENHANTVLLEGTGDWEDYEKTGIPFDYSYVDSLTIHLRGVPTETEGDEGTNGSPNSGTIQRCPDQFRVQCTSTPLPPAWNVTGLSSNTWARNGHALLIEENGQPIVEPRMIIAVNTSSELAIYPALTPAQMIEAQGKDFRIVELPRWRIGSLALYPEDRTA